MSRTFQTYSHELAPGLLLTVEAEERGHQEEEGYYVDDLILERATLTVFDGEPVDLLAGCPRNRDPQLWLDEAHPEKGALVDLCFEKGRVSEKAIPESEAA